MCRCWRSIRSSGRLKVVKTPKRSYHHGNLPDEVLQAAERALETGGVGKVSLREISRELGVSHTAPRRHFANKQALLDALAIHGYAQLGVILARAVAGRDMDFDTRLTKVARALLRFATRHPALLNHMFAAKHHPAAPPELLEASERALASGAQLIAEGQGSGDVVAGDPERLALVPFAAVQGLIAVSSRGQFKGVPLERLVEDAIARIIVGLRPRV